MLANLSRLAGQLFVVRIVVIRTQACNRLDCTVFLLPDRKRAQRRINALHVADGIKHVLDQRVHVTREVRVLQDQRGLVRQRQMRAEDAIPILIEQCAQPIVLLFGEVTQIAEKVQVLVKVLDEVVITSLHTSHEQVFHFLHRADGRWCVIGITQPLDEIEPRLREVLLEHVPHDRVHQWLYTPWSANPDARLKSMFVDFLD